MSHKPLQWAVDIKTTSGSVLKPFEVRFWDLHQAAAPEHLQNIKPHSPFKFFNDAILALSFHHLTGFKHVAKDQREFTANSYHFFDHYSELYKKSAQRVKSLSHKTLSSKKVVEEFENKVLAVFEKSFSGPSVKLADVCEILQHIDHFEKQVGAPLIYNFSVHFTAAFTEKLMSLYSFLFHLRSVVAVDHNAHVEDSSHDSVKCDSISDYLPKSDYTVNDAMLYWHFKKLGAQCEVAVKGGKPTATPTFVAQMHEHFHHYSHNACHLVDQLPEKFLNSLTNEELEEALHHVQMDWLLGSSSGLLFRIREELFGLHEGYEQIFWSEAGSLKSKKASSLSLCFELSEKDIVIHKVA